MKCGWGSCSATATGQIAWRRRTADGGESRWVVSDPYCDDHQAAYAAASRQDCTAAEVLPV